MTVWERMRELGSNPHWLLRTEKVNITIEMDPLRAPATVSAIDSLSRAGAYEGVPFHRVVPISLFREAILNGKMVLVGLTLCCRRSPLNSDLPLGPPALPARAPTPRAANIL